MHRLHHKTLLVFTHQGLKPSGEEIQSEGSSSLELKKQTKTKKPTNTQKIRVIKKKKPQEAIGNAAGN